MDDEEPQTPEPQAGDGAGTAPSTRSGGAGCTPLGLWIVGWLFTLGYADLLWWQALLALFAWPYHLGLALR